MFVLRLSTLSVVAILVHLQNVSAAESLSKDVDVKDCFPHCGGDWEPTYPSYVISSTEHFVKAWIIAVIVIVCLVVLVTFTIVFCCVCSSCPIYKQMHKKAPTAARPNVVTHVIYMDPSRPEPPYPQNPYQPQPGGVYYSAPPSCDQQNVHTTAP